MTKKFVLDKPSALLIKPGMLGRIEKIKEIIAEGW